MPRASSATLVNALATLPNLSKADLFTFTTQGGTVYRWAAWDSNLKDINGNSFTSYRPWPTRGRWNLTNKMSVGSLQVKLAIDNTSFAGGANLKLQLHNGLFDGASCLLQYAYMTSPSVTTTLGSVDIFSGVVGSVQVTGGLASLTVKSKTNILDQFAPRHVYQVGCNHAFCDAGCTLNRVSFTTSYTVGTSPAPTASFIPWASAPSNPGRYLSGTVIIALTGEERTVAAADSTGLTLAYPLHSVPSTGDSFTAFEGCDKQFDDGVHIQDCTGRSNTVNHDGFKFVPPPSSAY